MKYKNWIVCFICLTFTVTNNVFGVTVSQVLKKLDSLQTLNEDVTAKVQIVQQDVEQGKKLMEAVYFAKDINDLFLIVMTKPETEKGNGYLKAAKNFWMYRRNTRTFQHINRDESIAGSDANAGDFEQSKYEENYAGILDKKGQELITEDMLGKMPALKIELKAKKENVDYPQKIVWVRKDNYLPLKEQSFSLSGTLMVTQYFLKYQTINNKFIPTRQLVIDEFEKGNKTLWEISDITFKKIDDVVFTKAYLENLSK